MERAMSKTKIGVAVAAVCAAACAGAAFLPALLGGAAVGGVLAALEGEAALVVVLAVLGGGAYLWMQRSRPRGCGSVEDQGCMAGDGTCALPEVKERG
jgi:hypothetical protein